MNCRICRQAEAFRERYGLVREGISAKDQDRLGHDGLGHMIAHILSRAHLSVDDTASMTAEELMAFRGLGPRSIQRLRAATDVATTRSDSQ